MRHFNSYEIFIHHRDANACLISSTQAAAKPQEDSPARVSQSLGGDSPVFTAIFTGGKPIEQDVATLRHICEYNPEAAIDAIIKAYQ